MIFFVKLLFETCRYLKRCYTYKKINNVLPSHHLINLLTMFRTHTLNLFHYILSLLQKFLTLCVFNFKSVLKIQERDMTDFICISLITITYDGEKKTLPRAGESEKGVGIFHNPTVLCCQHSRRDFWVRGSQITPTVSLLNRKSWWALIFIFSKREYYFKIFLPL